MYRTQTVQWSASSISIFPKLKCIIWFKYSLLLVKTILICKVLILEFSFDFWTILSDFIVFSFAVSGDVFKLIEGWHLNLSILIPRSKMHYLAEMFSLFENCFKLQGPDIRINSIWCSFGFWKMLSDVNGFSSALFGRSYL